MIVSQFRVKKPSFNFTNDLDYFNNKMQSQNLNKTLMKIADEEVS